MATQSLTRSLLSKPKTLTLLLSRPFSSASTTTTSSAVGRSALPLLSRLRPLTVAVPSFGLRRPSIRSLSTSATNSSLSDPSPNWSNRPPKETILLDGCDFEHWLVVMENPQGDLTRDDIIDSYIKTLAQIVGSEEEARMKIYSVSTRCYFAFGCNVSEELSYKIKELPGVRWVLPDSYLDVKNKDYGGEPFIDGQAVPYDPKYHEEWIRNNARAQERNRKNNRPRPIDRSRTFERRESMQNRGQNPPVSNQPMQNRDFQNPSQPRNNQNFQSPPVYNQPMQNQGFQNPQPRNNQDFHNPSMNNRDFQNPQMNTRDFQGPPMPNQPMHNQNFQNPPNNYNNAGYMQDMHPNYTGGQPNYSGGGMPPHNAEWAPPSNGGGMPPNTEWTGDAQNRDAEYPQNFQNREYRSR